MINAIGMCTIVIMLYSQYLITLISKLRNFADSYSYYSSNSWFKKAMCKK